MSHQASGIAASSSQLKTTQAAFFTTWISLRMLKRRIEVGEVSKSERENKAWLVARHAARFLKFGVFGDITFFSTAVNYIVELCS